MRFFSLWRCIPFVCASFSAFSQVDALQFAEKSLWFTERFGFRYIVGQEKPQRLGWRAQRLAPFFADKPIAQDQFMQGSKDRLFYHNTLSISLGLSVVGRALSASGDAFESQRAATIGSGVYVLVTRFGAVATTAAYCKQYRSLQKAAFLHNRALLGNDSTLLHNYDRKAILLQRNWFKGVTYSQNGQKEKGVGFGLRRLERHLHPALTAQPSWSKAKALAVNGIAASVIGVGVALGGQYLHYNAYDSKTSLVANSVRFGGIGLIAAGGAIRMAGIRRLYRAVHQHNARVPFD